MQAGDIILEFDDRDILFSYDLPHVVGLIAPGTDAEALVMRDGRQQRIDVEVGALPGQEVARRSAPAAAPASNSMFGMTLGNIGVEIQRELRIPGGVLVQSVEPASAAARAGLRRGDVLVRLGFEEITSVAEFVRVASSLPQDKLAPVRFYRDGNWFFRTIDITD